MTSSAGTSTWTRSHQAAFGGLLALTMATSTFALTSFSVLSGALLDAFSLSRWQLGALVTATAVIGALTSPPVGRISDRIGGRSALQVTLALSAVGLAGIATSPVYGLLIAAAVASGFGQAFANPATNKLISLHVADGWRGTVTGVKQAGVQVGVFLGGALLPLGGLLIGWRATMLIAAVIPMAGLLVARAIVPADVRDDPGTTRAGGSPARSPFLLRLGLYGFLIGAGWSGVFTYLPDFAQTALGWSATTSGLLVATAGLCGIAGRIGWSWLAERRLGAPATLIILAAIGLTAVVVVVLSRQVPALLWLGAAAFGASSGSWNSVGMFAIIDRLPPSASGAASGIVMFGFLVGLGVGAPAFGWSVDITGAYLLGLAAAVVVHLAGVVVATRLRVAPLGAVARRLP